MFKIFMMTLRDFDGSLRDQDFHDDRLIFAFPYLIGYKALPLVKLSRACLIVKKTIYKKTLKYKKTQWGNVREKINTTAIIH